MVSLPMQEMAAAVRVLARGDLARYSARRVSEAQRFEHDLRATMCVQHALAVNSGTSALVCALVGAGIGPGDEVLVPAYTWVATAAAPLAVGAVPVLVEIDESLTIDPADVARKITARTKAVIPVHMLNLVCNMDAIMKVAEKYGIIVIEDACQAIGVTYRGRRVGSIGHAGAFSFNQHKNIRSGEGGALITNDARMALRASIYHDVGSYERDGWCETSEPIFAGVNYRMPELSAAILRPQLRRLDAQLARRRRRRRVVLDALASAGCTGWRVSPHHDPDSAVGLAVTFDDPDQAAAFGAARGVHRLIDTGKHVYTNWRSISAKRAHHVRLNAHGWTDREVSYGPQSCPATLEILERTCAVELAPDVPTAAFRLLVRRMVGGAAHGSPIQHRRRTLPGQRGR